MYWQQIGKEWRRILEVSLTIVSVFVFAVAHSIA